MSATCLAVGAVTLVLATPEFTLSWSHSVERVEWREVWQVSPDGLHLTQASVRGSGAGMEPAPDATLTKGWWVWDNDLVVPGLSLAASGATGEGWHFCADGTCRELGTTSGGPIIIAPCPAGHSASAAE